jgi:hypothetical protein
MLILYAVGLLLSGQDPEALPEASPRQTRPALRLQRAVVPGPAVPPDPSPEMTRRRLHYGNPGDAQFRALEYVRRRPEYPAGASPNVQEELNPAEDPGLDHWKFSGELTNKPGVSGVPIRLRWYSIFKGQADGWEEIETGIVK